MNWLVRVLCTASGFLLYFYVIFSPVYLHGFFFRCFLSSVSLFFRDAHFRTCLEQIEKRRAEVNAEMAEIVNRFEAATESLQPSSDMHNDSAQNNSMLEQSSANNHMDQSEDDTYYQNNFKSAANKRNDESIKHGDDDDGDDSSNDDGSNDDDTNDDSRSNLKKGENTIES